MVGLADIFRAAIGGNNRHDAADTMRGAAVIADAVDAFSGEASQSLLVNVVLPWAANVARFAVRKWGTRKRRCGFSTCHARPIGECIACHMPVCLGHAFVAADATLICWPCSRSGTIHAKPYKPAKGRVEEPEYSHTNPDQEPNEPEDEPREAPGGGQPFDPSGWAYAVLGVKPGTSEDEVRAAYRKACYDNHPDRATDPNDVKARSEKIKMINLAWETIRSARRSP